MVNSRERGQGVAVGEWFVGVFIWGKRGCLERSYVTVVVNS